MPIRVNPHTVIKASPLVIEQLLGDGKPLGIPAHQRDFVWKESHVNQLWSDIFDQYRRSTSAESLVRDPNAYFLGAMVVLQPNASDRREVIDGQQRITTLTCIISVLREYLDKDLASHANDVRGTHSQMEKMLAQYIQVASGLLE